MNLDEKKNLPEKPETETKVETIKNPELKAQEDLVNELTTKINNLKNDSEKYNNPSTYATYSKMQRQIIKLEDQLSTEKLKLKNIQAKLGDNDSSNTSNQNLLSNATSTDNNNNKDNIKETDANPLSNTTNNHKSLIEKLNDRFQILLIISKVVLIIFFPHFLFRIN